MKLRDERVIAAPFERAWETLLHGGRVARALPRATVESSDDTHRGSVRLGLSPAATRCRGTVRVEEIDDDGHFVSFAVQGREERGQAAVWGRIHTRLTPHGDRTRLTVEVEFNVTCLRAQSADGPVEGIASAPPEGPARALLREFAAGLEREMLVGSRAASVYDRSAERHRLERRVAPAVAVAVALGLAAVLGVLSRRAIVKSRREGGGR